MAVKGIERVRRNLRAKLQEIDGQRTEKAVYVILSQGASMSDAMTPIDTGTLINSRYAPQINQRGGQTVGRVGYTAAYAGAVHDAPGAMRGIPRPSNRGNYWDPNAEPRFLEKGFEQIKPSIPDILKAAYAR